MGIHSVETLGGNFYPKGGGHISPAQAPGQRRGITHAIIGNEVSPFEGARG